MRWSHADYAAHASRRALQGRHAGWASGRGPPPQVLPDAIKGPAAAACTALSWAGNLAVGLSFPGMLAALGLSGAYAVYVCLNVAAAVFVARLVVETSRRSLAGIQAMLLLPAGDAD